MASQNPDSKSLIEEGDLAIENVRYKYIIQLVNLKTRVTFLIDPLSPCTWEKEYTLEELKQLNPLFQLSQDEKNGYRIFKNCLEKVVSIKFQDKMMRLTISLSDISENSSFVIDLTQSEINMDQFLQGYQNTNMFEYQDIKKNTNVKPIPNRLLFPIKIQSILPNQKTVLLLFLGILLILTNHYVSSVNDQFKKYEEQHQHEIYLLQHSVKLFSSDQQEQYRKQEDINFNNTELINKLSTSVNTLSSEFQNKIKHKETIDSKIMIPYETQIIKYWNDIQMKNIKFDLIYRATRDGFQTEKMYEKCANKQEVLVLIKSNLGKRFGFYSDKEIKNYNGFLSSNPNKIYLFSLDTMTKYSSNDQYCPHSLYGSQNAFSIGRNDLHIQSNSNINTDSYNIPQESYGASQGIGSTYLSGSRNFSTLEIEVHQLSYE